MMIYNVDFLIAALLFLFIILYHFMQQQGLYMQNNQTFLWLVVLGILNICFNLGSTVVLSLHDPELASLAEFSLTAMFILEILFANSMLSHIYRQFPYKVIGHKTRTVLCAVLPGIFTALLLSNHWTGLFFRVSLDSSYSRGQFFSAIPLITAGYLLLCTLTCILYRSHMSHYKRYAVYEMVLIMVIAGLFQAFYPQVLIMGFSVGLAITVMFFTINNPFHYTDSMTSTFDVRYFRDRCQYLLQHHRSFHVLLLELSQMKRINNVTGTGFGNSILQTTALMLRDIDKENLIFRVTGKRFLVMTTSLVAYEAARTRILQFFSEPIRVEDREIQVPVTLCGILDAQQLGSSDNLLAYSEYLLSLVSSPQKAPSLIQNSSETLKGFRYNQTVDQFLNTAVQDNLFELVYQPVYSNKEGRFTSMEALSRLRHPVFGPISPDIFIRLAEKNDLIPQIGLLQLRRACQFLRDNPEILENMDSLKVNLSPVELMRPGHVDRLIATIREYQLPTEFFQFEITETVATEYSASLSHISAKFIDAGIKLCMDDFGSGYANLNTVFRLPFSTIKLDRSLLRDICSNDKAASLYQGLISSIHSMDLKIIAEGVETKQELQQVLDCGVEQIQGFYYSRPLPPQDLLNLIHKQMDEKKTEEN